MMILAVMMVMTISANAMSYNAAKHEALFLSDKMAYELNLTAAQYEAVYEINLDYLMSLNGHGDVFGIWWDRRNADLRSIALWLGRLAAGHSQCTLAMTEVISTTHTRRYSLPTGAATAIVTLASTLTVTCQSPLCITMLLPYIAMHQLRLRITESPQLHIMTVTAQSVTWQ